MSEIHVSCKDQVLKITEAPIIASGGVNETRVVFTFCEKWDGFVKTAVFYVDADDPKGVILDENDTCVLPWEVCATNGSFYITVFGNKEDIRRTSSVIKYKVSKGVVVGETYPSDPTPEVYEQIVDLLRENERMTQDFIAEAGASIEAANEATENANAVVQDLEEKRDSGYFKGEKGDPGDKDAVLYTEQTLTEGQKEQARANINAASLEQAVRVDKAQGLNVSEKARARLNIDAVQKSEVTRLIEESKVGNVLYTEQELTEDQKASARQNIGAASNDSTLKKDEEASVSSIKILHSPESSDAIFAEGSIVRNEDSLEVNALTLRGDWEGGIDLDSVIIRNVHAGEKPTDAVNVAQLNGIVEYEGVYVDDDITSTLTFEKGYYYGTNVKFKDSNGNVHCTNFIPVKAGDKFKITTTYGWNAVVVAEFDSVQTQVGYREKAEGQAAVTDYEYTVPSGVSYIVINSRYQETKPMVLKKVVVDSVKHRIAELEKNGGGSGGAGTPGKDGKDGVTPVFSIGEVETLPAGSEATASITGTVENPVLNLGIPKGEDGEDGSGGSSGIPIDTAEVGQTIVVKAVDENGKPTEWEAADLPSGGGEDFTRQPLMVDEDTGIVYAGTNDNEYEISVEYLGLCTASGNVGGKLTLNTSDANNTGARIYYKIAAKMGDTITIAPTELWTQSEYNYEPVYCNDDDKILTAAGFTPTESEKTFLVTNENATVVYLGIRLSRSQTQMKAPNTWGVVGNDFENAFVVTARSNENPSSAYEGAKLIVARNGSVKAVLNDGVKADASCPWKNVAHRGYTNGVRENTIASFQEALYDGCTMVEVDVRSTSDGVLVLCHDATITGVVDGVSTTMTIANSTLAQLKTLILSSSAIYGEVKIPTLSEALRFISCYGMTVQLDLKDVSDTVVSEVVRLVKRYNMRNRVTYFSSTPSALAKVLELDKTAKLVFYTISSAESVTTESERVIIALQPSELTDDSVLAIRDKGYALYCWGVTSATCVTAFSYFPDYVEYTTGTNVTNLVNEFLQTVI
ncbi:MAG: hypothetical protein IKW20_05400 [Bacteroidales bacterium]|nr:hypothetical protein [Bacteroidales bacterium]